MRTLLILAAVALLGSGLASGEGSTAVSFVLPNGLKVVLRPIEEAKSVAIVTIFAVGQADDPAGKSGLTHLCEHLYTVSKTGDIPARTVEQLMGKYTLGWNAQTGYDSTIIATVFPQEQLREELGDSSSRMADLTVTDAVLATEKVRMIEELSNMYEQIPWLAAQNLASEKLHPTPNGGRKGGLEAEINTISADDVRKYLVDYYKPSNATLAIAGAIDTKAVRELVEKLYSEIPAGKPVPDRPKAVAPADKFWEPQVVEITPVTPNTPSEVCLAYSAPMPGDKTFPAFLVLASRMLTRAYYKLKAAPDHQPVTYAPMDNPRYLFVSIPVGQDQTPEEAVEELDKFVADTVGRKLVSFDVHNAKSNFGMQLGFLEMPDEFVAQNPYWVALSYAWRTANGIDLEAMGKQVESVTQVGIEQAAKEIFAPGKRAAVVIQTQ